MVWLSGFVEESLQVEDSSSLDEFREREPDCPRPIRTRKPRNARRRDARQRRQKAGPSPRRSSPPEPPRPDQSRAVRQVTKKVPEMVLSPPSKTKWGPNSNQWGTPKSSKKKSPPPTKRTQPVRSLMSIYAKKPSPPPLPKIRPVVPSSPVWGPTSDSKNRPKSPVPGPSRPRQVSPQPGPSRVRTQSPQPGPSRPLVTQEARVRSPSPDRYSFRRPVPRPQRPRPTSPSLLKDMSPNMVPIENPRQVGRVMPQRPVDPTLPPPPIRIPTGPMQGFRAPRPAAPRAPTARMSTSYYAPRQLSTRCRMVCYTDTEGDSADEIVRLDSSGEDSEDEVHFLGIMPASTSSLSPPILPTVEDDSDDDEAPRRAWRP